jgi:hypothetical protein
MTYVLVVVLTMLVLPLGSMVADWGHAAPMILAGKWFVFWGVGFRLGLAGARQVLRPAFTAREIFKLQDDAALPIVRELGIANLGLGVTGVLSLARPDFTLPVALMAGLFYAAAGLGHVAARHRSRNETLAMVSDLWLALVLAAYVAARLL